MDPLGIAASVGGIGVPVLQLVRRLNNDIRKIVDAPAAIKAVRDELIYLEEALTSLQAITDAQWNSLGENMANLAKSAINMCKESCEKLGDDLNRWTRHSEDGKLSWRDRATVGFFKQRYLESMSQQFHNCKTTLVSVSSSATLLSSFRQADATDEIREAISTNEAAITAAVSATDEQLAGVNAKLEELRLARSERDETETDRTSAVNQIEAEQAALGESRKLLEALLSVTQSAAANAPMGQGRVINNFGYGNKGIQMGVNHGAFSNIRFGG